MAAGWISTLRALLGCRMDLDLARDGLHIATVGQDLILPVLGNLSRGCQPTPSLPRLPAWSHFGGGRVHHRSLMRDILGFLGVVGTQGTFMSAGRCMFCCQSPVSTERTPSNALPNFFSPVNWADHSFSLTMGPCVGIAFGGIALALVLCPTHQTKRHGRLDPTRWAGGP